MFQERVINITHFANSVRRVSKKLPPLSARTLITSETDRCWSADSPRLSVTRTY
jgi:hypothetical protein